MGHQRLGTLPTSRKWDEVVAKLSGGADATTVAAATADAAEAGFYAANGDDTLRHAFYLLARIPLAAHAPTLGPALRALGLQVTDAPTLVEVGAAVTDALDDITRTGRRPNDLGEMATLVAAESLVAVAGREGASLFGARYVAEEAHAALRRLSGDRAFGLLVRDFFARLTRRCLDYYLSRTLANHVGVGQRFASVRDHHLFDEAMTRHCWETARIVEEYAAGWYSKAKYEGEITPRKAGAFAPMAFDKVRAELRKRQVGQPAHA